MAPIRNLWVRGLCTALWVVLATQATHAQDVCDFEQALVSDPNGLGGSVMGTSVAVQGDLLLGGAMEYFGDPLGDGKVIAFGDDGTSWNVSQAVECPSASFGSQFGAAVAVDANWMLVGAPYNSEICFLRYNGNSWNEFQHIPLGGVAGTSVALQGNVAVVANGYQQTVYVYRFDGSLWVIEQQLTDFLSAFAVSVDLDNGRIAVGVPVDEAAYLYTHDGSSWQLDQTVTASDAGSVDSFGFAIALYEGTLVVGAPFADVATSQFAGAVYTFEQDQTGTFVETQKIDGPTGVVSGPLFGKAVDVHEDVLVIGAPAGLSVSGAADLYRYDGISWQFDQQLLASDGSVADVFGTSVATDGARVVVGAPNFDGLKGGLFVYPATEITLLVDSTFASPGDTLSFTACKGQPSSTQVLFVTDVDGVPTAQRVIRGIVGANGSWVQELEVPPGLSGLQISFAVLGTSQFGNNTQSNAAVVEFL